MKVDYYPESSRGKADHGRLKANFSFSFAHYFDPRRMGFGVLRVLNDDIIEAGAGFGTHPHDNMEIITIPLKGALEHKDSMDNIGVIHEGEVQVMSAGTGVTHSEYNHSQEEDANTLQIWVLPERQGVEPRYDQKTYPSEGRQNHFQLLVSPDKDSADALWIHQQAYFSRGEFESGKLVDYKINCPGNGVYLFVIEGEVAVDEKPAGRRDALGITDTDRLTIRVNVAADILLLEVPMSL